MGRCFIDMREFSMNCKVAQNMILTDYIDERSTAAVKTVLETHLTGCVRCREHLVLAHKMLVDPFHALPRERMPQSVMNAILDQLREKESARENEWFLGILEGIHQLFSPSPVVARVFATVFVCFLVSGTMLGVNLAQQSRQDERVLFLAQAAEISADKGGVTADYGTAMESYFLEEKGDS